MQKQDCIKAEGFKTVTEEETKIIANALEIAKDYIQLEIDTGAKWNDIDSNNLSFIKKAISIIKKNQLEVANENNH